MRTIALTRGYVAQVSDKDYTRVNRFKWGVSIPARRADGVVYVYAVRHLPIENGTRKSCKMHRFILGVSDPSIKVDHEDHNGLNNQRRNLRKATDEQNQRNVGVKSNNTSGFKGVRWNQGKWQVSIRAKSTRIHIGVFSDLIEAAKAYDAAAIKYHGKFAYTNF